MASFRDAARARQLHALRKTDAIDEDGRRCLATMISSGGGGSLDAGTSTSTTTMTIKRESDFDLLTRKSSLPNGHSNSTIFDHPTTTTVSVSCSEFGGGRGSVDLPPHADEKLGVSRTSSTESTSRRLEDALHSLQQISAESVLSSLGAAAGGNTLSMNNPMMPPKCLIQEDIRQGGGRFDLVRKRGRSEVWNLFGQVLDTQTGNRLPYVACYACKVLYTDTGGGTGNMTRHRCPLGNSYRSSYTGSSTDATDNSVQQSFESTNNNFLGEGTISPEPNFATGDSVSPLLPVQPVEPPYPDIDRRNFNEALIKCCAVDVLPSTFFEGRGFQSLIETAIAIGRRNARTAERFSAQSLIPDPVSLNQAQQFLYLVALSLNRDPRTSYNICAQHNALKVDLKTELSVVARECGISLAVDSFDYGEDEQQLLAITASYITSDWRLSRRMLKVQQIAQSQSAGELIWQIITGYGIDVAERLMFTTDRSYDFAHQNIQCICVTLNGVLDIVFRNTDRDVRGILQTCKNIVVGLEANGLQKMLPLPLRNPTDDYWMSQFPLLANIRSQMSDISYLLGHNTDLLEQLNQLNETVMQDLETFLEPFYEAAQTLKHRSRPTFHQVLPEWYALMHECEASDDGDEEPRPWLTELRQSALKQLRLAEQRITIEHRMATVLNPRLRQVPVICTEEQRVSTYKRLRELTGTATGRENGSPNQERTSEDRSMVDDELECYLRSQFPAAQTKDVLHFWSTSGQAQFPRLSRLARFLLAIPATCPNSTSIPRLAKNSRMTIDSLDTLLFLRSCYQT